MAHESLLVAFHPLFRLSWAFELGNEQGTQVPGKVEGHTDMEDGKFNEPSKRGIGSALYTSFYGTTKGSDTGTAHGIEWVARRRCLGTGWRRLGRPSNHFGLVMNLVVEAGMAGMVLISGKVGKKKGS